VIDTTTAYPVQYPYTRALSCLNEYGKPVTIDISVPMLQAMPISFFPEEWHTNKEILPCIKTNGQFIFGNHTYPDHIGLPKHLLFWEEDPIQSINLFDAEFAFAFPNVDLKVLHFYINHLEGNSDQSKRQDPVKGASSNIITMRDNYLEFIYDPINEFKKVSWEDWSHIKTNGTQITEHYIPSTYR
jgi:hypothetical protein